MGLLTGRAALLMSLLSAAAAAWAAEPLELAVKAAYLAKFPYYVEWPAAAFSGPNSPLVICVSGDDPIGTMVEDAVAGQQVQGHPLAVRRVRNVAREAGCHVAYVGEGRPDALRGSSALVVADAPASGATITFVLKDNRVRFTVDDELAAQSSLVISSKLLSVALAVKPRGSPR